jgi:AraC-like DNA-binding protein
MGVSLTRYRNRVRLSRALDRLEQGEGSLAAIAADLGFADQAHLCRSMSQHMGHTPAALRRLLTARESGTAWNASDGRILRRADQIRESEHDKRRWAPALSQRKVHRELCDQ